MKPPMDVWSQWVLQQRSAGDAGYQATVRQAVEVYEAKVLAGAGLKPGETLLDVGAGEGFLARRAIAEVGDSLTVVLTDISPALLHHAREAATAAGVAAQCHFITCSADHMPAIADGSVDVVVTRSALAYVADKPKAVREFARVLRPGGRISLAEPLFRDRAMLVMGLRRAIEDLPSLPDTTSPQGMIRLLHRWNARQLPDTLEAINANPLTNYTDRDFIYFAQQAGLSDIHMELHIDICPSQAPSWEVYLDTAPHPTAPTWRQVLEEDFSPQERALLEAQMRPGMDHQTAHTTTAMVYLTARKGG